MPNQQHLSHLIKLLDDESEVTQSALKTEFGKFCGDISDDFTALDMDVSAADRMKISHFLLPARRAELAANWTVPDHLDDDWDSLEHLLNLITDYIHDGITLQLSLSDALDLLAEEYRESWIECSEHTLRKFLFTSGLLKGEKDHYYAIENSDIVTTIRKGRGNPLSLCIIYQLVARRLDLNVTACNYPGHFVSRIHMGGQALLVDCFNLGKVIPVTELLQNSKEIPQDAKFAIHNPAPPRVIIHRVLRNMEHSLTIKKSEEDVLLMQKLQSSLMR